MALSVDVGAQPEWPTTVTEEKLSPPSRSRVLSIDIPKKKKVASDHLTDAQRAAYRDRLTQAVVVYNATLRCPSQTMAPSEAPTTID